MLRTFCVFPSFHLTCCSTSNGTGGFNSMWICAGTASKCQQLKENNLLFVGKLSFQYLFIFSVFFACVCAWNMNLVQFTNESLSHRVCLYLWMRLALPLVIRNYVHVAHSVSLSLWIWYILNDAKPFCQCRTSFHFLSCCLLFLRFMHGSFHCSLLRHDTWTMHGNNHNTLPKRYAIKTNFSKRIETNYTHINMTENFRHLKISQANTPIREQEIWSGCVWVCAKPHTLLLKCEVSLL